jgi:hypothetical protein
VTIATLALAMIGPSFFTYVLDVVKEGPCKFGGKVVHQRLEKNEIMNNAKSTTKTPLDFTHQIKQKRCRQRQFCKQS